MTESVVPEAGIPADMASLPDADGLLSEAIARTGLTDFGPIPFREPLEKVLGSLREESQLTQTGLDRLRDGIVNSLATRLQLQAVHEAHPSIGRSAVAAPIIIIGLPRSGTTNLHSLLAQDTAHRVARTWEVSAPFPAVREKDYWTDPRIDAVQKFVEARGMMAEEIQAALPYHATSPAECGAILDHAFMSQYRQASARTPAWSRWRDHEAAWAPAFAFHKQFLQHLQTHYRAERWLLKSPEHLISIESLAETYPDAIFIQTHRDPALVLGSVSSLICALRRMSSTQVDPVEVGREQFEMWAHGIDVTLAARKKWGANRQVIDVRLADIARDPLGTVESVYSQLGVPFTDQARSAMHAFVGGEESSREQKHNYRSRYELSDFGLDKDLIHERFGPYMDGFGIAKGS
ncbi:MAG: sulfotransferase [Novosphingobium sp.]|nr:sulfotransferase [Novosphingobium sp.]